VKVKELLAWLTAEGKDLDAEVEVEISVFPDEHNDYLEVVPLVEGMEGDGPGTVGLAVDLLLYDPNPA
jgi:hypothetical protein